MEKLKAAVVGGGTGGKLSLAALHSSDLFDLVAVTGLRQDVCDTLAGMYPGIQTFTNYREMFSQSALDVVCVSTYPPSHEEITIAALELPLKGILVEKPLGHTTESGKRILDAVKRVGIPMAVPHGLLARAPSLEILKRVHDGEIGYLKLVEIESAKWDIINAGIHWLNFFVRLTKNEPLDHVMAICESSTRTYRDGMQVETTAVTYAQTTSGIRVVMNTGDDVLVSKEGKECLFRLIGSKGFIEFWGWDNEYYLLNAEYPTGKVFQPTEFSVSPHQFHLDAMAGRIQDGTKDYSIPESSLIALEICEGAYVSSRHQSKVTFPLTDFTIPEEVHWEPGQPYTGVGGGRDGRQL